MLHEFKHALQPVVAEFLETIRRETESAPPKVSDLMIEVE